MNWKKIDERYRYTVTVIWMNTVGVIVDSIRIIKTNKKMIDPYLREENMERLKIALANLLLLIGMICLAVTILWAYSKVLLIVSLTLILLGIGGRLMSALKTFIDEFIG